MPQPNAHDISLIMNLVAIRKSVHELTFSIAVMVLGFLLSGWWSDAPIVAAASVCVGAVASYYWDRQAEKGLQKSYWKRANAEDAED